jgi:hypothetical protein
MSDGYWVGCSPERRSLQRSGRSSPPGQNPFCCALEAPRLIAADAVLNGITCGSADRLHRKIEGFPVADMVNYSGK